MRGRTASKQMTALGLVVWPGPTNNEPISNGMDTMNKQDFDELAGRIDGMGQTLLRLTAELEMQGVIDGSRVSAAWVQVADQRSETTEVHRSAHRALRQLAQMLDEARSSRLSRWLPD